jgi:uncharacterized RDD family membrane protein YckC
MIDVGIGLLGVLPLFIVLWIALTLAGISSNSGSASLIATFFLGLVGYWTYASLMECSRHQATLGKMHQCLKVTDNSGSRISLGRAAGRNLIKFGSLFVACVASLFTARQQGLHDLVSGTRVQASEKPAIDLLAEVRAGFARVFSNKTKN